MSTSWIMSRIISPGNEPKTVQTSETTLLFAKRKWPSRTPRSEQSSSSGEIITVSCIRWQSVSRVILILRSIYISNIFSCFMNITSSFFVMARKTIVHTVQSRGNYHRFNLILNIRITNILRGLWDDIPVYSSFHKSLTLLLSLINRWCRTRIWN